jgi:hypothetical protein
MTGILLIFSGRQNPLKPVKECKIWSVVLTNGILPGTGENGNNPGMTGWVHFHILI